VPLRYGVLPRGSRSLICDRADGVAPPASSAAAAAAAQQRGGSAAAAPLQPRVWHPLFTEGCAQRLGFAFAGLRLLI
jgi:hypothetical protein